MLQLSSMGSSDHFFFCLFYRFLVKNGTSILIEIKNILLVPLVWYFLILLILRMMSKKRKENVATIFMTGPRLQLSHVSCMLNGENESRKSSNAGKLAVVFRCKLLVTLYHCSQMCLLKCNFSENKNFPCSA